MFPFDKDHWLSWNTAEIEQMFMDDVIGQHEYQGLTISEEDAREIVYNNHEVWDIEWEGMCDVLGSYLLEICPSGKFYVRVENFGWKSVSGEKHFAVDMTRTDYEIGAAFLGKILPNTDCTFYIFQREENGKPILVIDNAHHDKPMGGEIYTIYPEEG
jgi:hypothetical protein